MRAAVMAGFSLRRPGLLIGMLAIASLAGGFLAIPQDVERIEMLARDGNLIEAVELADEGFASGSRDPRLVELVFSLNNQAGRVEPATIALDELLERSPEDLDLWRRALNFFTLQQNLERKIEASVKVAQLSQEPRDIAAAASLLSLHGRFEEEIGLLRDQADHLSTALGVRLASREVALGNTDAAAEAAMEVLEQEQFDPRSAPVLAEVLLLANETEKIETLADVLSNSENVTAYIIEETVVVLAMANEVDAAAKLASAAAPASGVRPQLIWQLAEAGRLDVAANVLSALPADATSRALARAFVDASIAGGQGARALATASGWLSTTQSEQNVLTGLALTARLYEQFGYETIAPLRGLIGVHADAASIHEPVLLASILADEGNPLGAARVLSQSDPDGSLATDAAARLLLQGRLAAPPTGEQRR
ncbi:MAG: hypothetical protein AAGH43_07205 [Pseudomonadota bacterium]